jgi:hypothetical protein
MAVVDVRWRMKPRAGAHGKAKEANAVPKCKGFGGGGKLPLETGWQIFTWASPPGIRPAQ